MTLFSTLHHNYAQHYRTNLVVWAGNTSWGLRLSDQNKNSLSRIGSMSTYASPPWGYKRNTPPSTCQIQIYENLDLPNVNKAIFYCLLWLGQNGMQGAGIIVKQQVLNGKPSYHSPCWDNTVLLYIGHLDSDCQHVLRIFSLHLDNMPPLPRQ
jgi:hypothetical protein